MSGSHIFKVVGGVVAGGMAVFSFAVIVGAADQEQPAILYACAKDNGPLRLVDAGESCQPNEQAVHWATGGTAQPETPSCDVVQTDLTMVIGDRIEGPSPFYDVERLEIEVANTGDEPAFLLQFEWAPVSDDGTIHGPQGFGVGPHAEVDGYEYPETIAPGESRTLVFTGVTATDIARPGETITRFIPVDADFFCGEVQT